MKKIRFETTIDAPRERVWDVMLAEDTYRLWTAEFAPGSYYEGSWNRGAKIVFTAPGCGGMVAEIADSRRPEFVSIRHLGMIENGVENITSEAVQKWAPAYENYTFVDKGGATELHVEMDVVPEFEEFMTTTWPKALARLKALCEAP